MTTSSARFIKPFSLFSAVLFCLVGYFTPCHGSDYAVMMVDNALEDSGYLIARGGSKSDKALEAFYHPCPFPCHNFTKAFLAEANAVWFVVDSLFTVSPNATGKEFALRIEITRHCRLDVTGTFKSDHILVTAEELEHIRTPKVGDSYVAAVIPDQITMFARDYRLVTPLVPADSHYPWKHLCRSCLFVNSSDNLDIETTDIDQRNACSCGHNYAEEPKQCPHVTIGSIVVVTSEYHEHAVLMVIIGVGTSFSGLVLVVGLAYWRWRKYKERRRIERSVVPRVRGCQLDHPGPDVTGSPPPVPITRSQLFPLTAPFVPINTDATAMQEQELHYRNDMMMTIENMSRQTSATPLLAANYAGNSAGSSPPDSPWVSKDNVESARM